MRLNNYQTTLSNAITASDTTITIPDTTNLSAGDYLTFIDNLEIIKITSVDSATQLTVQRGIGGTTATDHGAGAVIQMRITAQHLDDIQDNIDTHKADTDNPHSVTASQVGAITAIIDDAAPKLGGNLNSNGHIVVDSDTAINNNIINKIIIPSRRFTIFSFETYDFVKTAVSGSGAVGQSFSSSIVYTGTTANSEALEYLNSPAMSLAAGMHILMYLYTHALSGNTLGFMGVSSKSLLAQTSRVLTDIHAGIFYEDGKYYASSADGTNQELTELSITGFSNYLHLYYDGSKVRFYVGNTLVATHTTYAVSGAYPQIYVNDKGNGIDTKIYWYNFYRR